MDVQGQATDSVIRKDADWTVCFFDMAHIAGYNVEHPQIISTQSINELKSFLPSDVPSIVMI